MTIHLPPGADWEVWRLVHRGWATLQEIETHWSFADLMEANAVLDAVEDGEKRATQPIGK